MSGAAVVRPFASGELRFASTTLTGSSMALVVQAHYPVGVVAHCHLLRRGFNHVYQVELADGRRCVARLSALRPRGAANVAYETALLLHLKSRGAAVAAPWLTKSGAAFTAVDAAEGERALVIFDHLPGEPPGEALRDIEAMGEGLARLHQCAQGYSGPPSLYTIGAKDSLQRPVAHLLGASTLDDATRKAFQALTARLQQRMAAMSGLSWVACHGDCHGGNTHLTTHANGSRIASFFDFDDAAPGYLAYDLAVYFWACLGSKASLDDKALERWTCFLKGYRRFGTVATCDIDAIPTFAAVRLLWLLGEYAARADEWGSEALPKAWLEKQLENLTTWETLPMAL